jgi:hypothetical protein
MDVGLNNRNKLGEVDKDLADIVFLVEATTEERFGLWKDYSKQSQINNIPVISDEILALVPELIRPKFIEQNNRIKNAQHPTVEWEEIARGFGINIGQLDNRPIMLEFTFAIINGHKIAFYNICSQVADYKLAEEFLIERFQLTHDGYTRWNHTNATNFHNCISGLDRLDKEPRDIYKKN